MKRAVVFIDENQLISPLAEGRGLDFVFILKSVKDAGLDVVRMFIYCSEMTEKKHLLMARSFFRSDNPLVRFIKTGNTLNEADRRIREDVAMWSQSDLADVIVLGTSDGGQDFLDAIAEVKKAGKIFTLLKTDRSFNMTLRSLADAAIDASQPHPRRRTYEGIIDAALDGNFESSDTDSRFVVEVANALMDFFKTTNEAPFSAIVKWINNSLKKKFDGYAESDVSEVIDVLNQPKRRILDYKKIDKKMFFHLSERGFWSLKTLGGFIK